MLFQRNMETYIITFFIEGATNYCSMILISTNIQHENMENVKVDCYFCKKTFLELLQKGSVIYNIIILFIISD